MTLKRYKKKWDVQKVKAFSEIATMIGMEHVRSGQLDKKDILLQEIYHIAIREIRDEPWFALSEADKLLQHRKYRIFGKKEENKNER